MKQSIQLRLGQNLTMTPQLQQAIRLLQLSSLELQTEIQEALESNPLLENPEDSAEETSANEETSSSDSSEDATQNAETQRDAEVDLQNTDMPDELPVDTAWEDVYEHITPVSSAPSSNQDFDERNSESVHETGEDLREHLLWQMGLTPFSETDEAIATMIIDSINDDGYLTTPVADIHQSLSEEHEIELQEVEAVLRRIQSFDPVGVAARDLGECLHLQLQQLEHDTPWRDEATRIVTEHLDLLGSHDFNQLIRRMKMSEEDLQQTVMLIRSLNPRPGSHLSSSKAEYIVPDVYVKKVKGIWKIELNAQSAPKLRINQTYAGMIRRADNSSDNNYLKNHLQEARWFLKSLMSRNETLLKVATCIVERQRGFLEHGEEAMKALVLHDVAEEVSMHESTISRVTTRKYMHTPRGIYELKYFFSSHVNTSSGGECSSTAIRAMIKKLIAAEEPKKPLSDSKLAKILDDQGIKVARRTVAKYREAMSIPPSNERKRLL